MDTLPLETLEKRVQTLESKIITKKTPLDQVDISKVKPVLDSLGEVDTVLLSALSGRERITNLFKKLNELEKVLDPSYLETKCNLDMKIEDVLESESDITFLNENVAQLEKLEPSLNGDVKNLAVLPDRLMKLMSELSNIKKECSEQSIDIRRILKEYYESMTYISKLFIELDTCITQQEIKSLQKKK